MYNNWKGRNIGFAIEHVLRNGCAVLNLCALKVASLIGLDCVVREPHHSLQYSCRDLVFALLQFTRQSGCMLESLHCKTVPFHWLSCLSFYKVFSRRSSKMRLKAQASVAGLSIKSVSSPRHEEIPTTLSSESLVQVILNVDRNVIIMSIYAAVMPWSVSKCYIFICIRRHFHFFKIRKLILHVWQSRILVGFTTNFFALYACLSLLVFFSFLSIFPHIRLHYTWLNNSSTPYCSVVTIHYHCVVT